MGLSRRAMGKLLPLLESGKQYMAAVKEIYPAVFAPREPVNSLPPVALWQKDLRNPTVARCLTETRKVVNALIQRHGKPSEIRIELARDLRNSKKQRQRIWEENRDNERARKKARENIAKEMPAGYQVSGADLLKVRLAEECHWTCPYTGRAISMKALVGHEPQFDIEHIIPFSKSLDNSFANLTLCGAEHNRTVKGRRSPSEAYGANPEVYLQILERVRQFRSPAARRKLQLFTMTPEEVAAYLSEFEDRLLNDTRYATKLATEYLGLLYGGAIDSEHRRRIRIAGGRVTAILRDEWKLNSILKDGATENGGRDRKWRGDHRHHAVDAIVTALTSDGTIQMLSRAAESAPIERRRRFASVEGPWPDFTDSVRDAMSEIIVSHRVSKKVSGALHEETLYSRPFQASPAKMGLKTRSNVKSEYRVRKPLAALTNSDLEGIADAEIKKLILEKLSAAPGAAAKDVFSNESNLPSFVTHDGRRILVRNVRVRKPVNAGEIGGGPARRYVVTESNHHIEIYAELDKDGREVEWSGEVVPLLKACQRLRDGEPVVKRDYGPGTEFRFSLAPGEVIEANHGGQTKLLLVRGCTSESNGRVSFSPISDARQKPEQIEDGSYTRKSVNALRAWKVRKVRITPLGGVVEAHD